MFNKYILVITLCFLFFSRSAAQDLIRKVPAEANFLVTVNNKAIFKHLSIEEANSFWVNTGLFKGVSERGASVQKLEDLGIDLTAKAYFYAQTTDSVQYFGGLVPLTDVRLFENFVLKDEENFEMVNGLKTIYSKDRTLRISWDSNTVYLLVGTATNSYFTQEEVRQRYGLPEDPYLSSRTDYPYGADAVSRTTPYPREYVGGEIVQDVYEDTPAPVTEGVVENVENRVGSEYEAPISAKDARDTLPYSDIVPPDPKSAEFWEEEYRRADSILARDEYQDDFYKKVRIYDTMLDSMVNVLTGRWVDERMAQVIDGRGKGFSSNRGFTKLSDNTILDFRVRHLDAIFSGMYYPVDILYAVGMGLSTKPPKIDHGIEEISGQIVVNGNKLVLNGEVGLDREMTRYYKAIYGRKINPRFLRYLDQETLGFMSFNVHTEAYLKYFPRIMDRYYGSLGIRYNDYVGLGTLLFDVLLDEKAIAKVFKGDNLAVVDGFEEKEVTYTDYEYDDNFQYKTIEKTKKETVPRFLWMFSSDDFRIFDKLIEIALSEKQIKDIGGIYELKKNPRDVLQMYLLMKDGIVFIGSNLEKLQAIQSNRYTGQGHRPYVDIARKNSFSMLFNTSRFTDFVRHLDLPVGHATSQLIDEMKYYGDFYVVSPGMKRNKLKGEMGIELPNEKGNALSFLFGWVERWAMGLKLDAR